MNLLCFPFLIVNIEYLMTGEFCGASWARKCEPVTASADGTPTSSSYCGFDRGWSSSSSSTA